MPALRIPGFLTRFSTDHAVRAGVLQAAWSIAPSYARGLLPRSATQQAMTVGVNATAMYALGVTSWSAVSSIAAGTPGHSAGWRARLTAAAVAATTAVVAERALRPHAGDGLAAGAAWSGARLLATTGLAGGLITASDTVAHEVLGRTPTIETTLLLDVGVGAAMAAGSMIRRNRRAERYGLVADDRPAVAGVHGLRAYVTIAAIASGTAAGIAGLAVAEQLAAESVRRGLTRLAGTDLGESGIWLSHSVTGAALAGLGLAGLGRVRERTVRANEVIEDAYPSPPTATTVSCGPNSAVDFDAIGKEGRRFVLMALRAAQISNVMGEAATDPIRAVIPREGSVEQRVALAVDELVRLGGLERSVIVVAAPTGVGYVNYVMAEALEYLTRGNCAIVVPQYALVPSALALNKTTEATQLQAEVLEAIDARIRRLPAARRPRLYQFGESLGAQVALDVAAVGGIARLDALGVTAGLYLGVPFRSRSWQLWRENAKAIDPGQRLVLAASSEQVPQRSGLHVMVVHDDDPVSKFAYDMVVRRPWWFGPPKTRPPMVPRETLFRPVTSFVIAIVDLLNGMNQRPGQFQRVGHDYRIDLRQSLQRTFALSASATQAEAIERALREREQMWAETRLVAKTAGRALRSINQTLDRWGQSTVSIDFAAEEELDLPEAWRSLMTNLTDRHLLGRLGSSGGA